MTTELRSHAEREADSQPTFAMMIGLFGAFVIIWALYFTITEAPVAIKHDMAEAYAWGQEFQLGYTQHPPFWAWLCGLWFLLFPRTGWAFALLSSLNAAIGLWGAWMLIGNFAAGRKRIAAWVLLLLTPLYTFYAYKYDANIIFLSIWPWTLHYFVRSVQGGTFGDAILFGLFIGLGLMSKYYAAILLATCLLTALLHRPWRRYLVSSAPYVSACVAALVCAPHLWWLLAHRAPPLRYLANISGKEWGNVASHATKTLLDALGMQLGVLFVVGYVGFTAKRGQIPVYEQPTLSSAPAVLVTLALAPLALTVASALVLRTDITPEMTIGTFALVPLLVIEVAKVRDVDRLCRSGVRLAAAVTLGALVLSPAIALERTFLSTNAMKAEPFQEVASEATRLWHDHTSLPLAYVAGSTWYVNTIAFYSSDRPHVFVYFEYSHNLWVTPGDLRRHGLLAVCVSDDAPCLDAAARFATPEAIRTEILLAHEFWGHMAKPVHFVVTIIPPTA